MCNDNGYFGKGLDGYVHYMQAFEESHKGGGGRKPSGGGGCLTSVISAIVLLALIALIFS